MDDTSVPDGLLLEKLFAGNLSPFHYRLGLHRLSASEFYGPGADAVAIRAEKRAILGSAAGGLYLSESDQGWPAFCDFTRWVEVGDVVSENATDHRAANLAVSLALGPDHVLMTRQDGAWRLAWASVCFPTRWSLAGKIGRTLGEIHGVVPGLNEQLGPKIDTFFERLVPGEGWGRANWGLSTNAERNQHPNLPSQPLTESTPLENVWLRLELQHLAKLPGTGAIAFGIRILSVPIKEVRARPAVLAGLREQLRTMPVEVAAYKGIPQEFWKRLEEGVRDAGFEPATSCV